MKKILVLAKDICFHGRSAVSVNRQVSSSGAKDPVDMSSSTMYATSASVAAQSPQSPSEKVVESKEVMRNGFPIEAKVVDRELSDSTSDLSTDTTE